MMVIAACGEEDGVFSVALGDLEAKDAMVESEGTIKVGDLKVYVTDPNLGVDGGEFFFAHVGLRLHGYAAGIVARVCVRVF